MYSKSDCIESLREAAEELGRSPHVDDYRGLDISPSVKTMENKFGSWNEAKEAAGLDTFDKEQNLDPNAGEEYARSLAPSMFSDDRGYERFKVKSRGETLNVYHHRLLAISEYGFEEVSGKDVHHVNGIKWDNRPDNIEVLTRGEHMKLHRQKG